jgi:hypothetical protein
MNDAAILARAILAMVGVCRICGCCGDSCRMFDGDRCVWMDEFKTLCSNPDCIMAAVRERKKHRNEQRKKERRAAEAPRQWWAKPKVVKRKKARKVKGRAA